MANKKKIEERLKAKQAEQRARTIRTIGAGVIILVLVGLIWLLVPGQSSNVVEAPADNPVNVPASAGKQYDAYPPMTIDAGKKYFAQFVMANGGEFMIELYPDKAPLTVNSFVFLARDGFYDGLVFHRVIEGFMAQGGDPTGTGAGGPGYQFADEFVDDLRFDGEGILAMANAGPGTNGSQFFITYDVTDWLNDMHTIFGRVTEGMDVVFAINQGDAIKTIVITEE